MDIPRELRMELNQLSKDIFGVPSKWQKILKNGSQQVLTRKSKETVPGVDGAEDTVKEVDVPVLTPHGAKQIITKHYTLEEVHQLLLTYKGQIDTIRAEMKKQQDEKAAKEAEERAIKAVQEAATGSAAV